jgi:hypothetical protein
MASKISRNLNLNRRRNPQKKRRTSPNFLPHLLNKTTKKLILANIINSLGRNIRRLCADIFNKQAPAPLAKCVHLLTVSAKSATSMTRCRLISLGRRSLARYTVTTRRRFVRTLRILVTVSSRLTVALPMVMPSWESSQTRCHLYHRPWCSSTRVTRSSWGTTLLIFKLIRASLSKKSQFKILREFRTKWTTPSLIKAIKEKLEPSQNSF